MLNFQRATLLTLAWTVFLLADSPAHAQRTSADNHVAYYQQRVRRNFDNARAYHGLVMP